MALRQLKKSELAAACKDINLTLPLGAGGNGQVYSGHSGTLGNVAVKFFLNDNSNRYQRFRDEVLVLTNRLNGSPRILPVLQKYLPDDVKVGPGVPWYAMPAAVPLKDALKATSWFSRLEAMAELAEGLAELHAMDVAHRDIKPENLFELNGTYRFGDFGIASFPESAHITKDAEPMGPWGYMAPEMLSSATTADAFKADVFSFAKTVWAVLTQRKVPFLGHYAADMADGLSSMNPPEDFVVEPFDALLERCTRVLPSDRPTAVELAALLRDGLSMQNDFRRANSMQWEAAEGSAIRRLGLVRAVWTGASEIANVLAGLSRRHGLNHCFFPDGGGQDIERVAPCEGGTMLTLHHGFGVAVVKPVRLILERFPSRPDFGYAVLETADVGILGDDAKSKGEFTESLRRVNEFDYIPLRFDDDDSDANSVGVVCERYFRGGVFFIAPKSGVFNDIDDYTGTAAKMGTDELRQAFEKLFGGLTKAADQEWKLSRQVRLLGTAEFADLKFELEFIDEPLLKELIKVDDDLAAEQSTKSTKRRGGLFVNLDDVAESLVYGKASQGTLAARNLLDRMTPEQKAEYLTLVQVGRGQIKEGNLREHTCANVNAHDDGYLLGKLGNKYMRKALARCGWEAP